MAESGTDELETVDNAFAAKGVLLVDEEKAGQRLVSEKRSLDVSEKSSTTDVKGLSSL